MRQSKKTILTGVAVALGGLWASTIVGALSESGAVGFAAFVTATLCIGGGIFIVLHGLDQMSREPK